MTSSDVSAILQAAVRAAKLGLHTSIAQETVTPTQIISCEAILDAWQPGAYEIGDVRKHSGQVWRCCQAHDNANNPDIEPGKSPAQWAPYHSRDPRYAKPFVQPTGAHDTYQAGEWCIFSGALYCSTMDGNAYSPVDYPTGWEKKEETS